MYMYVCMQIFGGTSTSTHTRVHAHTTGPYRGCGGAFSHKHDKIFSF